MKIPGMLKKMLMAKEEPLNKPKDMPPMFSVEEVPESGEDIPVFNPPPNKHWSLAAKTVVAPHPLSVPDDPQSTRLSLTGKTTYLFVCEETGEFHKEEIEGVEPTDLDDLIDKVNKSGPEYVTRSSGTFILMKKPQDTLPVR
jgi:hypothetical protein